MAHGIGLLAVVALFLASMPLAAQTPGNKPRKSAPDPAVLALIPATHTLFFHANVVEMAKKPALEGVEDWLMSQFGSQFKEKKTLRLAKMLGLSPRNLVSYYHTADIRKSRRNLRDVIAVYGFKAPVDLEGIITLSRKNAEPGDDDALQTEMVNGQIVFVHERSDLTLMQVSPKLLLISYRPTVKRITKLKKKDSLAGNEAMMALIKKNKTPYSFAGTMVRVPDVEIPFLSMRFVLPSTMGEELGAIRAVIRDKNRHTAATLAKGIKGTLGKASPKLKVVQKGDTLSVTLQPSREGVETIFRNLGTMGLWQPSKPESGAIDRDKIDGLKDHGS